MRHNSAPFLLGCLLASSAIFMTGTTASAQDDIDPAIAAAVKARKAHMDLSAFNIGILGAMAKGEIPYDANVAESAAQNLAALSRLDESQYWIPGSDIEALGKDHTGALPSLWSDNKFQDHVKNLQDATDAMVKVAGQGLDQLRGQMGPLGKACGGCHEDHRAPKD